MKRIETKIDRVCVEIEGRVYVLAEKTIAVAEALRHVRRKYRDAPGYRLWLAELRILLDKRAMNKLFSYGDRENLDRMQRIHGGVLRAFEYNAAQMEEERLAAALRQLCRAGEAPVISRSDAQEREG
ncbi:MAG: hypothetical protein Q4G06_05415 [Clostridia bacterium]|nr:hypothetical protein [Clostridia bacterium]